MASPARTARSGSSSCVDADPPHRHDGVTDVLVDAAAERRDRPRRAATTARSSRLATTSASSCDDIDVNPLTSANSTVTWRRRSASVLAASSRWRSAATAASTISSGTTPRSASCAAIASSSCRRSVAPPVTDGHHRFARAGRPARRSAGAGELTRVGASGTRPDRRGERATGPAAGHLMRGQTVLERAPQVAVQRSPIRRPRTWADVGH